MTDLTVLALDKAFQLAEKNPQHWGVDAILKAAGEFHQFLTEGNLAEPLEERVALLEDQHAALQQHVTSRLAALDAASGQVLDRLNTLEPPVKKPSKPAAPDKPVEF